MVMDKAMKAMVMLTQLRKGQLMHIPVTLDMEIIHSRHLDLGAVGWFHIQVTTQHKYGGKVLNGSLFLVLFPFRLMFFLFCCLCFFYFEVISIPLMVLPMLLPSFHN